MTELERKIVNGVLVAGKKNMVFKMRKIYLAVTRSTTLQLLLVCFIQLMKRGYKGVEIMEENKKVVYGP